MAAGREEEEERGETPYGPFGSAEAFELAEWILDTGISQRAASKLLRTRMVERSKVTWPNARAFLQDVDKLPISAKWKYRTLEVPSDQEGIPACEVELFYRNPVDLVKELIGNPDFNNPNIMAYEPVKIFVGKHDEPEDSYQREYSEAWTGDWWHSVQVRYPYAL